MTGLAGDVMGKLVMYTSLMVECFLCSLAKYNKLLLPPCSCHSNELGREVSLRCGKVQWRDCKYQEAERTFECTLKNVRRQL